MGREDDEREKSVCVFVCACMGEEEKEEEGEEGEEGSEQRRKRE